MGDAISFGHGLLAGAGVAITAILIALAAADNALAATFGASAPVVWVADMVGLLIRIMIIVGIAYAYILPMMPFLFLFAAAIAWLVAVISATIASSVWAFLWVRMDGQELVDSMQRQGMLILFNMVLRPALLVLGFSASMMLHPFILNTLNSLWVLAFYGGQGGYFNSGFSVIISYVIHFFVIWQIPVRLFGLITTIPDEVAYLYGAPGSKADESGMGTAMTAGAVGLATQAGNRAPGIRPGGNQKPPGASTDERLKRLEAQMGKK